jgi:hypothetical protein
MTSRIQQRAICPVCFAQQATKNGLMVAHGYTRPQSWHANIGTCYGAGRPHFGTEAGRKVTADVAVGLRCNAVTLVATSAKVLAGDATVYGRKRVAAGTFTTVVIENPTQQQRAQYAASLVAEAEGCKAAAVEFDAKIAGWVAAEPVAVPVEAKQTIVHMRAHYYSRGGHKACASSAMGAMRGYASLTDIAAEVTCERCKGRKVFVEAVAKQAVA